MMYEEICLDTSVIIALFRGDARIRGKFETYKNLWLPSPARAEVLVGIRQSKAGLKYDAEVQSLFQITRTIVCDDAVAETYAVIKNGLMKTGEVIPNNDIWIAACAMTRKLTLATKDAHFRRVKELLIEMW